MVSPGRGEADAVADEAEAVALSWSKRFVYWVLAPALALALALSVVCRWWMSEFKSVGLEAMSAMSASDMGVVVVGGVVCRLLLLRSMATGGLLSEAASSGVSLVFVVTNWH